MNPLGFINPRTMLIGIIALAFTSGCVSPVSFDQSRIDYSTSINQETAIGQSFLARYDGIEAISVYFKPAQMHTGNLNLVIKNSPDTEEILAEGKLPVELVTAPGYYRFQLDKVVPKSASEDLFFEIKLDARNEVAIGTAAGNTYLQGSAYLNRIPTDNQLAFHVHYDQTNQYFGLISEGMELVGLTIIALLLLVIPGWGIFSQLLPDWSGGAERGTGYSFGEKVGISSGFSIVIYPILYLWSSVVGLQIGSIIIWIPFVLGAILIIFNQRKIFGFFLKVFADRKLPSEFKIVPLDLQPAKVSISSLYIIIFLLLIVTRFWPVRVIDFPMWGDSYQHTMIAQLLIDNNGLFDEWKPYADLITFTYHFGFHTIVAAIQSIARIPIESATLWAGQYLNIFAVLALYPLASRLAKSQWAGISAIAIAGFLTSMPMYYINWGRYTQLAGMIVLASTVFLIWITLDNDKFEWAKIFFSGVALAGLALTHFRVVFFAIFFCLAYVILSLRRNNFISLSLRLLAIAIVAAIIFLPWFIQVYSGRILDIFSAQLSTVPRNAPVISNISTEIGNLANYLPPLLWFSVLIAIGWGLWRKSRRVALFSIWWLVILFATNPQWLTLPGTGIISNFTLFIAAYFPASLLIGAAVAWIIERITSISKYDSEVSDSQFDGSKKLLTYYISLLLVNFIIVIVIIWGAGKRLHDVQPDLGTLMTRPDYRAMDWIKNNISQDGKILINSFSAFYDTTIVGSDGGWWIPLITLRSTNVPPINYFFEQGPHPDYREWINELTFMMYQKGIDHPDILNDLYMRGFEYIYIGQRDGEVNSPSDPYLNANALKNNPNFSAVYHQDRVWIFEIIYPD